MTPTEALRVLRKLAAFQPNQQIDEFTKDAWADALAPLDGQDALDAVGNLAVAPRMPGQPFLIELRDIYAEVGRLRSRRLQERRHLLPQPPSELTAEDYRDWLIRTESPACERDWSAPPRVPELPHRPVRELTAGLGDGPADPDTIRAIRDAARTERTNQ